MSWTFHATGVAIAKWCLVIGGSGALWTAATLCFTVAFVPTSFLIYRTYFHTASDWQAAS
ncbi:hypothetical protein LC612_25920 [Nostoc sp. CHAB 5834]|nr:hypothetical protein [Nostoc sp. CHAB 5834]